MAGEPDQRTRPTALAVALSYEMGEDEAPVVIATGRGHVADRILAIAFENGVKVREDADLAEMLAAVDVGSEIPVEAFVAVAEIMAYLYRLNGRLSAAVISPQPSSPAQGP